MNLAPLSKFISTGFYSGLFPFIPGTVGTFLCALMFFCFFNLTGHDGFSIFTVLIALFISVIGYFATKSTLSSNFFSDHTDPREIVIDEFAGYAFAILFLPATPLILIVQFFLFRILDILKPRPIRDLEKLPGALGIMADDIAAGLIANAITQVLMRIMT